MKFKHEGRYYTVELKSTNTTFLMPDGVTMGALVTEEGFSSLTFSWVSYPDFIKEDPVSRAAYLGLPIAAQRWLRIEAAASTERAVHLVRSDPLSVVMVRELVQNQAMFLVSDTDKRDFLMELLDDIATHLDRSFTISTTKIGEVFAIGVHVVDIFGLFWSVRFAQNGEWRRVHPLRDKIPPPPRWEPPEIENDYDG